MMTDWNCDYRNFPYMGGHYKSTVDDKFSEEAKSIMEYFSTIKVESYSVPNNLSMTQKTSRENMTVGPKEYDEKPAGVITFGDILSYGTVSEVMRNQYTQLQSLSEEEQKQYIKKLVMDADVKYETRAEKMRNAISLGLNLIPIVGDAKGLLEAAIGIDLITFEGLSVAQRVLSALLIVPGIGEEAALIKAGAKDGCEALVKLCGREILINGSEKIITKGSTEDVVKLAEDILKFNNTAIKDVDAVAGEAIEVSKVVNGAETANTAIKDVEGVAAEGVGEVPKVVNGSETANTAIKDAEVAAGEAGEVSKIVNGAETANTVIKDSEVAAGEVGEVPKIVNGAETANTAIKDAEVAAEGVGEVPKVVNGAETANTVIKDAEVAAGEGGEVSKVVNGAETTNTVIKDVDGVAGEVPKVVNGAETTNTVIKDVDGAAEDVGKGSKGVGEAYTGGRTQAELEDLARDPSHAGRIEEQGIKEREVGLALEERGDLGNIVRDTQIDKGAEFIDTTTGLKWDVKSFESYPSGDNGIPITNPKRGAFTIENGMKKIQKEFKNGNNVIIDARKLVPEHIEQLKKAIDEAGIADRIIWYP